MLESNTSLPCVCFIVIDMSVKSVKESVGAERGSAKNVSRNQKRGIAILANNGLNRPKI